MGVLDGTTVLLRSPFVPSSGYGRDGIALATELLRRGVDLHIEPYSVAVPLPAHVGALMSKPRPRDGRFDFAIEHTDPEHMEHPPRLSEVAGMSVGWTMWEYSSFSGEPFAATLRDRLAGYDLVIAYDQVSRLALSGHVDPARLRVLQGGYESEFWRPRAGDPARDWDGTFRFGMLGQLHARKNPFASIDAMKLLKARHGDEFDATLDLKTNVPGLPHQLTQAYRWLRIHLDAWTGTQLREFYLSLNCYLAPSWGEGKHLAPLEAGTLGCPSIVSPAGGHMEWYDESFAYLVDGELAAQRPHTDPTRLHFEVRPEALAERMWHVYTHRSEAREKGLLARDAIPAQCDWERVVDRLDMTLGRELETRRR